MLRNKAVQREFNVTPNAFAESLLSLILLRLLTMPSSTLKAHTVSLTSPVFSAGFFHQIDFKFFISVEEVKIHQDLQGGAWPNKYRCCYAHFGTLWFFLMRWYSAKSLFISDLISRNEVWAEIKYHHKKSWPKTLAKSSEFWAMILKVSSHWTNFPLCQEDPSNLLNNIDLTGREKH